MCTRFSSATAQLSTAINVQIYSYSHDESTSEVVWLDSVWMRLKHKEEHNTQHKMLTQEHHSTTIRIYTMANAIAPQRCENATGWRILMYVQRDAPLNVTTVRNMHRPYIVCWYRRGHIHISRRQCICTQQEVTSHQAHHQQWIRIEIYNIWSWWRCMVETE